MSYVSHMPIHLISLETINKDNVSKVLSTKSPFSYDLRASLLPGPKPEEPVMICHHGYGADYSIIYVLRTIPAITDHLVGFNLPDYSLFERDYDPAKSTFGSIEELLPALYVWKKIIIDAGVQSLTLYGFSAGGGVVVNGIGILNGNRYDTQLKGIGIGEKEKKVMLEAIQKGLVILECPLKSIQEIIDLLGSSYEFETIEKKYRENELRPIDNLKHLSGLSLNVMLYFVKNDEVLSNRDDAMYIERLQKVNSKGKNWILSGNEGGHVSYHPTLWKTYEEVVRKK